MATEWVPTGELGVITGLSYRQINRTSKQVPGLSENQTYNKWLWNTDDVRRWQVAAALARARTGLETQRSTRQTSLVTALRAVYHGPPPSPTRFVALSSGVVSYVDVIDDVLGTGESILLVPMPLLWPTNRPLTK